jgi:diadenylate cyclase
VFVLLVGSLILNLVVRQFAMERIAYLYGGFLVAILIVAVTAFQPELRRALIRIGQAELFVSNSPQQLSRCVEELVEAVNQMSVEKIGAIIVIPQQVPLGEFVETGVRIDAKVTSELIKTIFYEGSPLHDMAMIIEGDRIVAARVQLPLAEADNSVYGRLGSRHRAAVGVTNTSDAIVIVVSEETGILSVAMNGQLIRNISETQLRRHLHTAVIKAGPLLERLKAKQEPAADADDADLRG